MADTLTRREALRRAAASAALPFALSPGLLGGAAPSDRVGLGAIGLGHRGRFVLGEFLRQSDVRCRAVCDCFADRRKAGKELVDRHYGDTACAAYGLHEEVLGRADIDAVLIATGDRWHAVLSVLAARAGKDVYCEKPICLTIAEGRALVQTTERYGTVWQCGTQRRSNPAYRFVAEKVHGGAIGRLRMITMSFGGWGGNGFAVPEPEPEPYVFDYDRWLGQAPWAPYSAVRVNLWRNNWDTGAGPIADMGPHYLEFAAWARGDPLSAPAEFEGRGEFPEDGFANVPFTVDVRARYGDGVILRMDSGAKGVLFEGDAGRIGLVDSGEITAEPVSILGAGGPPEGHWNVMDGHIRNFLQCMRTRRLTASNPEAAHRAHTVAHVANICLRLGRKVRWDAARERFHEDREADNLLSRTMRAPWRV